jgi:predicted amidophosphoribosyltransferase
MLLLADFNRPKAKFWTYSPLGTMRLTKGTSSSRNEKAKATSPIAAAIHRAKYHPDPSVARALGAALRSVVVPDDALVVPIPLHPKRFVARGFNHSGELARGWLGAGRVCHGVLARARDTPTQTALHRDARRENVRDAFVVRAPARVRARASASSATPWT